MDVVEGEVEFCGPSMKVPPKRKGNGSARRESNHLHNPSMKVPPKRKGNGSARRESNHLHNPSMKVPPKRKGNHCPPLNRDKA